MKLQELNVEELKSTNGGRTIMAGPDTPMVTGTTMGTGDDNGIVEGEPQPTMFTEMMNRLDSFDFKW